MKSVFHNEVERLRRIRQRHQQYDATRAKADELARFAGLGEQPYRVSIAFPSRPRPNPFGSDRGVRFQVNLLFGRHRACRLRLVLETGLPTVACLTLSPGGAVTSREHRRTTQEVLAWLDREVELLKKEAEVELEAVD